MDDETKTRYETKAKDLKTDLKTWENEWAKTHAGSKPGRQDIKDNPDIAQKYKEYNKVRDILSGKQPPPAKPEPKPKKRQPDHVPTETPLKRTKYAETPSKQRHHDEELMNTPAISRKLFSPAPVTSLGPTPQRDGRVLGLFDLLVEKELGTPSKKDSSKPPGTPSRSRANILSTPSKRTSTYDPESISKLGRTPMSSSKRNMLNTFATPLKNRRGSLDAKTPSSVSKLQFDTPAFLKRHSLPVVDENAMFADPAPLRLPRKPLVRGLSEIVASLRKVEDDVLDDDDDLDALREAEGGGANIPGPMSPSLGTRQVPASTVPPAPALVEDSQRPALLGGFDDENMYDSPVEDGVDQSGNPLPVYKKKGQKRTTRKSNIKPLRKKRPEKVSQDSGSDGEDIVPETQAAGGPDGDFEDVASGSDFEHEDVAKSEEKPKKKDKKEGPVKKVARKVNELAHANFHRLKLRNNGAKGGPGYNSRFRRRR
ncbi:DNA replication regulator SLD2 [Pochonia chlamydosporia 170]|uniref:DNA replication regulator SLD2 n=1 Tax=Pochonia chlamydosporia 170 TaxID=1380566 RepID=A0A179FLJ4_METCM|nr:DNA replication regulator SLD2 [Pochonia chlamydosporia 170]OAQ66187.1 DNA replication regulator SLD2 [Pochonia chlamydosporia 170]